MRRWPLAHLGATAAAAALAAEWMRASGWVLAGGLAVLAVVAVTAAWLFAYEYWLASGKKVWPGQEAD